MRLWVSRVAIGMNKDLEFVITPVSGAIGADVSGIDVSGPLDQKIVTALNDAFLEHKVLAIRCLLYTSPSPRDGLLSRMPSSA